MRRGTVIDDRFVIEHRIAAGGMGSVYSASDRDSGARVALKFVKAGSDQRVARFGREAGLLSRLRHPGIVPYVAHGTAADGTPYLAMEWLDGQDLARRLRERCLPLDEALALLERLCAALAFAHGQGVIHRDIKPSNVFLVGGRAEGARLLDFGVARAEPLYEPLTGAGVHLGTPGYMAPEQIRGGSAVGPAADVFALGCVFVESLTGQRIFGGEHAMAVQAKVLLEDVPPLSDACPDVSPALDELVARMLAKDPRERPADGAAVAAELERLSRAPRARAPSAPGLSRGEQRWISVLVAARTGAADPSAATADTVIDRSPLAVGDLLRPLADEVHTLSDGSLVVAAQGPETASDDAGRLARAALAARSELPELPLVLATGRSRPGGRLPFSEVIDRAVTLLRAPGDDAARLDTSTDGGAAAAGAPIRLDEVTAALLDTRFEIGRDGAGFVLLGQREPLTARRTLLGQVTPFVGRARVLGHLEATFEECLEEPVARAVLVTAPAGGGKSRLCAEFLGRVRERAAAEVWMAQGEILGVNAPYGLLARGLKRSLGLRDGDRPGWRRRKLRARLARLVSGDDLERLATFLGEMTGTDAGRAGDPQLEAARRDPQLMADQLRRAWLDWARAMTEVSGPLLVVVDDLHWADLPTVKAIDAALRELADRPLMVLALARPEVHARFPDLWASRALETLELGPLTPRARERLVRSVLPEVAAGALARVVEQSAGNAFFLEELIRGVAEERAEAPSTVLAMVQSRLDALPAPHRRLLRAASLFGDRFTEAGALALLGGAAEDVEPRAFAELVDAELLTAIPGEGEPAYAFRHSLVRETAYATLTARDRVLGHRLAGEWLERRGDAEPMVLAEHFERGELPARALSWYRRSAQQALEAADLDAAVAAAERGLACGGSGDDVHLLQLARVEALRWLGRWDRVLAGADELLRQIPAGTEPWYRAVREVAVVSNGLADREHVIALGRALLQATPAPSSADLFVGAAGVVFQGLANLGEHAEAGTLRRAIAAQRAHLSIAAAAYVDLVVERMTHAGSQHRLYGQRREHYRRTGDRRRLLQSEINLGYAMTLLGAYEEAAAQLAACLERARGHEVSSLVPHAQSNLGLCLGRLGELDEAAALERAAIAAFQGHGDRRQEVMSRVYLAEICAQQGDLQRAEREARAAVLRTDVVQSQRSFALAVLSAALRARGQGGEALERAEEAMRPLVTGEGFVEDSEAAVRLAHIEALIDVGRAGDAGPWIRQARDYVTAGAALVERTEWVASYRERVPEHRRILELAGRHLSEEGT